MLSEILPEDMVNEAMGNIEIIADQCNLELSDAKHYPHFDNAKELLRKMCEDGIKEFYPGDLWTKELADRMEYELETINKMGFNDYFCEVATLSSTQKHMEKTQLRLDQDEVVEQVRLFADFVRLLKDLIQLSTICCLSVSLIQNVYQCLNKIGRMM